jgi:hypothetical protein
MDHLQLPRDPTQPCPVIPLFSREPYDKKPFLGYLKRNPGTIFLDSDAPAIIYEAELCTHFQKWLFFGLLCEFLGELYDHEEFIRYVDDGENAYLRTTSLPAVTAKWFSESLDAIYERDPTFSHFATCLDEVAKMLKIAPVAFPGHSTDFGLLLDAISSIAELFKNLLESFHEDRGVRLADRFATTHSWLNRSYQTKSKPHSDNCDRMRAAGWCPNDINRALNRFPSVEAWHYFRHLRLGESSAYHATCDYSNCKVINVKKGTNVTGHVDEDCCCGYFEIESDQLTRIYREGRIPCLTMTFQKGACGCSDGCLRDLSVSMISVMLDDASAIPYTAISHVWSDGTGNIEANNLPYCLLERLFESTRSWRDNKQPQSQGEPVIVWIDTLCCPFEQGEGKQLALSRMKEIYSNAAFTVVFDKSLRTWEAKGASTLEYAVRLFLSPWMRRLWTAQEAILASVQGSLVVNYLQCSTSINNMMWELQTNKRGPLYCPFGAKLSRELVHIQKGVWYGLDELPSHDNMLALLSSTLQYRTASVASDEALVIATLLGFEAELVLGVSHEEAMCRIWNKIPSISGGLSKYAIFARTSKLNTPGYRWAPRSFMDSWSHNLTNCYQVWGGADYRAKITPRGLVATYPGILFRLVSGWHPLCIFGNNDGCKEDPGRIIFKMPDETWAVIEPKITLNENVKRIDTATKKSIHAQLHEGNLALVHPDSRAGPSEESALLVSIGENTEATIFACPEHIVYLTKLRDDSCELAKAARECAFDLIAKLGSKADGEEEVKSRDDDTSDGLEAVVDQHVWRTVEDHSSIRDIIIAENKKNIHEQLNLDMDTVVAKFKKHVHFFGHLGNYEIEVLPEDQKWCIG